jgi:hypothetical protein
MLVPYTVKHDYGATVNHPGSSIILLRKIDDRNTNSKKVKLTFIPRIGNQQLQSPLGN